MPRVAGSMGQFAPVASVTAAQADANKIVATVPDSLSTLDTSLARYVHAGDDATIGSIQIVLGGAFTADSTVTITTTIDDVAVTDGALAIIAADAGADTVHVITPSAANTVTAGAVVKFTVATAANLVASTASLTLQLTRD